MKEENMPHESLREEWKLKIYDCALTEPNSGNSAMFNLPFLLGTITEIIEAHDRALKDVIRQLKAVRDDEPLKEDANRGEIYGKEAQNNMADGYNLAIADVLKLFPTPTTETISKDKQL